MGEERGAEIKRWKNAGKKWRERERERGRSRVGECKINHLFNGYLDKVTPQPILPDRIADFEYTEEERGWVYIPPGFKTIEEYINSLKNIDTEIDDNKT